MGRGMMDAILSWQAVLRELGSSTQATPLPRQRSKGAPARTPTTTHHLAAATTPFHTPHTETPPPGCASPAEAWHSIISTLTAARSRRGSASPTRSGSQRHTSSSPGTPRTARQLFDGSPGSSAKAGSSSSSPASRRALATSHGCMQQAQEQGPHTSPAQQLAARLGQLRASAGAVLHQQQQSSRAGSLRAEGGSSTSKQRRSSGSSGSPLAVVGRHAAAGQAPASTGSPRKHTQLPEQQLQQQQPSHLQQKLRSALDQVEQLLASIAQGQQAFLQHTPRQPEQLQHMSAGQPQQQQQQPEKTASLASAAGAAGSRHSATISSSAVHSKQRSALAENISSGSPAESVSAPAAAAQPEPEAAADGSEPESPLQTKAITTTSSGSNSTASPGHAGAEEQASPATPPAALPRVHTPGKPATEVAAQTSTPQLARSAAAVLSVSEAWRLESSTSNCRWQQLLDEWSASKPANPARTDVAPVGDGSPAASAAQCARLPAIAAAEAQPAAAAAAASSLQPPPPHDDAVSFAQPSCQASGDAMPSPARLPGAVGGGGGGHAMASKECPRVAQALAGDARSPGAVSVGDSEASELSLASLTGEQRQPAAASSTARRKLLAALDEADAAEASSMSSRSSSRSAWEGGSKRAAAAVQQQGPANASPPPEQPQQQPAHAGSERLNELVARLASLRQQLQEARPSLQRRSNHHQQQLTRHGAGQSEQQPASGKVQLSGAAAARSAAAAKSMSALRLKLQESRAALEALAAEASAAVPPAAPAASLAARCSRASGQGSTSNSAAAAAQAPTKSRSGSTSPSPLFGQQQHMAAARGSAASPSTAAMHMHAAPSPRTAAAASDRAKSYAVAIGWQTGRGHHAGHDVRPGWHARTAASRVHTSPGASVVLGRGGSSDGPRCRLRAGGGTWLDSSPWPQQQQQHGSCRSAGSAPLAGTLQRWAQEGSPRAQLAMAAAAARQQQQHSARLPSASDVGRGVFACSMAAIDVALSALPGHGGRTSSGAASLTVRGA